MALASSPARVLGDEATMDLPPSTTLDILHPGPLASLEWSKCSELPVKMQNGQAVWLKDRLYVGGGSTSGSVRDDAKLYIYTPLSDEWSTMDTPVYGFALVTYHSQLVVVGGQELDTGSYTNKLWTLVSGQWKETIPPMTEICHSASAVEYENNLIVAGGKYGSRYINIVEVYNGHHWASAQSLPIPYSRLKSTVLNGHWYLMGGRAKVFYTSLVSLIASSQPNEKPPTSVWKRLPDVPVDRSSPTVFGNRLIAVGGNPPTSSIYAYSPHTHSWIGTCLLNFVILVLQSSLQGS